jgi:DNA-binding NtrC family response regulator
MVAGKGTLGFVIPGSAETEWKFTSSFPAAQGLLDVKEDLMRALCQEAVRRSKGNKTAAAKLLGISRNALYRHMTGGVHKNDHGPEQADGS